MSVDTNVAGLLHEAEINPELVTKLSALGYDAEVLLQLVRGGTIGRQELEAVCGLCIRAHEIPRSAASDLAGNLLTSIEERTPHDRPATMMRVVRT